MSEADPLAAAAVQFKRTEDVDWAVADSPVTAPGAVLAVLRLTVVVVLPLSVSAMIETTYAEFGVSPVRFTEVAVPLSVCVEPHVGEQVTT